MPVPFPAPRASKPAPGPFTLNAGWHLSPQTFEPNKCPCQVAISPPAILDPLDNGKPDRAENDATPSTAGNLLRIQRERMTQVWQALTDAPLDEQIKQAGGLVDRQLRELGYELLHLAAVVEDGEMFIGEGQEPGEADKITVADGTGGEVKGVTKIRAEARQLWKIFIYWLTPCGDAVHNGEAGPVYAPQSQAQPQPRTIGHRWLAQLVLEMEPIGKFGPAGRIFGVKTRFQTDLEDWTIIDGDCAEYTRKGGEKPVRLDSTGWSAEPDENEVYEQLKVEVSKQLRAGSKSSETLEKLFLHLRRGMQEIKMGRNGEEGKPVRAVEVETVYRRLYKDARTSVPVVRVALMTVPSGPGIDAEVGAVILLLEHQADNVRVAYKGEWPICHTYRKREREWGGGGDRPERELVKWLDGKREESKSVIADEP